MIFSVTRSQRGRELIGLTIIIIYISLSQFTSSAFAVSISQDNMGEYILLPVIVANDSFDTLIQIHSDLDSNHQGTGLKIRFMDRDGNPVQYANLYLYRAQTWSAAITKRNNITSLLANEHGCLINQQDTLPSATQEIQLAVDVGYLEIIEMGTIGSGQLLESIANNDCEQIAAMLATETWNDAGDLELSPPAGLTRANGSLINIPNGTLFPTTSVALEGFSARSNHTPPNVARPDFRDAFNENEGIGTAKSVVCINERCHEDWWADPVDAVSAALMSHEAHLDIALSSGLAALTEGIVLYPTRAYYDSNSPLSASPVSIFCANRSGQLFGSYLGPPTAPPIDFLDSAFTLHHARSLEIIDFATEADQFGKIVESSILHVPHRVQLPGGGSPHEVPRAGQCRIGFESLGGDLTSPENTRYLGRPAIVVGLQSYQNGQLVGSEGSITIANYGKSIDVSLIRRVHYD